VSLPPATARAPRDHGAAILRRLGGGRGTVPAKPRSRFPRQRAALHGSVTARILRKRDGQAAATIPAPTPGTPIIQTYRGEGGGHRRRGRGHEGARRCGGRKHEGGRGIGGGRGGGVREGEGGRGRGGVSQGGSGRFRGAAGGRATPQGAVEHGPSGFHLQLFGPLDPPPTRTPGRLIPPTAANGQFGRSCPFRRDKRGRAQHHDSTAAIPRHGPAAAADYSDHRPLVQPNVAPTAT